MATPCTVSGTIIDASGGALNGVAIDFYGFAPLGVGTDVIATERIRVVTGPTVDNPGWAAGFMSIDLAQGSRVRVQASRLQLFDIVLDIPATATADFATLVEAAR